MDEPSRSKYDDVTEEMVMATRRDFPDIRPTSLYQPTITLPTSIPSQRDVLDFSFGRKDLMSATATELKDLSKDDRLVLETFKALTAGNVGTNFWQTRGPVNSEPALPQFTVTKPAELYNTSVKDANMLISPEVYISNVADLSIPDSYTATRISKTDDRIYFPSQPLTVTQENQLPLLPPNIRSHDPASDPYRTVLGSYRFPTYPPSYESSLALNVSSKPRSQPPIDNSMAKMEELEKSAMHATRDREHSNLDFETMHVNTARMPYPSDTVVSDLHVDKTSRHSLDMDFKASDFSTDRLRELAETVVYSHSLGPLNNTDSMQNNSYIPTDHAPNIDMTCVCIEELTQYAQGNRKKYNCGVCSCRFITICQLHEHLRMHVSEGSYYFDYISQTAYPKFETTCSYVQTEDMYNEREGSIDRIDKIQEPQVDNNDGKVADVKQGDVYLDYDDVNDTDDVAETCVIVYHEDQEQSKKEDDQVKKTIEENQHQNEMMEIQKILKVQKDRSLTEEVSMKLTEVSSAKKDKKPSRKRKQDCPKSNKVRKIESERNTRVTRRSAAKSVAIETDDDTSAIIKDTDGKDKGEDNNKTAETFKKDNSKTIMKPIKKRKALRKSNVINLEEQAKLGKHEKAKVSESKPESQNSTEATTKRQTKKPKTTKSIKDEPGEKVDLLFIECEHCKRLIAKHSYKEHLLTHDVPHICETCGKKFSKSRFLKKHQVVHAAVKPWKCQLCGQQFCQKSELKVHMNGHDNIRPFECDICKMGFLCKTTLRTHMDNIHRGITRFECEVCNRRFYKKSSFNIHVATHFEATLSCSYCERKFRDKTGLKRHERMHTGVKRFQCHICDHAFIQSTPFWVHMEKRHNMDKASVKDKLKELQWANKRSGLKIETQKLPRDEKTLTEKKRQNAAMNNSNTGMNSSRTGMNNSRTGMNNSRSGMNSSRTGMNNSGTEMNSSRTGMDNSRAGMKNRCTEINNSQQDMFSDECDTKANIKHINNNMNSRLATVKSNSGIAFPVLTDQTTPDVHNSDINVTSQDPSNTPLVSETINRLFSIQGQTTQADIGQGQATLPTYKHLVRGLVMGGSDCGAAIGLIGHNSAQSTTCTSPPPASGSYFSITSHYMNNTHNT